MKSHWFSLVALSLCLSVALPVAAEPAGRPDRVFVPDTSIEAPSDRGIRAHTNHRILLDPDGGLGPRGGMTPDQIRAFYGITLNLTPPNGSGIIAIVDAYHYPSALNDFNVFSSQFGLPKETSTNALSSSNQVFQVVYASNKQPRADAGWAQEAALDIEWAHAMAPNAKIVLVEANTNSFADLLKAVDVATQMGAKQVSMSWGGSEFSSEASYDFHFRQDVTTLYFASSGDTGGVTIYPSASPNVVAVGGTSVQTDSAGSWTGESGWSGSGGGPSKYESAPGYQSVLGGAKRQIPDISTDADPYTGVSVYDSTKYQGISGWLVFGGTSVSSPTVAGIVNLAGHSWTNTSTLLSFIYAGLGGSNYRDIIGGKAGSYDCISGWDYVTGVGAPNGLNGL
jgi:subtilase family serine protease